MFTIYGRKQRFCDGVSRRGFLKVGALGIGGLTLADLYRAEAFAETQAGTANGGRSGHKSVINIWLPGGASHLDTFDPKPLAPPEFRGEFGVIDTRLPGVQFSEYLPLLAGMMDKLALIRSLTGLVDDHTPAQTETGWPSNALMSVGGHPSIGSVVSRVQGVSHGSIPTFVDLANVSKPGFLGPAYRAFRPDDEGRSNLTLNGITLDRLGDRKQLLSGLDRIRRESDGKGMMAAMDSFTERAVGVVTSGKLAHALNLELEDPRLRRRYSLGAINDRLDINDPFLLARRLVESGVRSVSLAWGSWDTHGDNFRALKNQLPLFDQGVSTLVEDLDSRGMLNDVLVLVWGEFGRTPRVNPSTGRDHWPRASCVLMAGGGMRMGQVIGSTNRLAEEPRDRPVHFHEVFSTVYQHMGIDPRFTTLTDPNGRPQYLVEHPLPVQELLA